MDFSEFIEEYDCQTEDRIVTIKRDELIRMLQDLYSEAYADGRNEE